MTARTSGPAPGPTYLRLEKRIADDERGGILHRWRYGRELLKAKTGRKQLPHGMLDDLVKAAERAGLRLSRQEIQRRVRCAEVYRSETEVRHAMTHFGSWFELIKAGFPAVDVDDEDPIDDMEEVGVCTPDFIEPALFEIPGFKPVLKINGRKVDLAAATVRQAVAGNAPPPAAGRSTRGNRSSTTPPGPSTHAPGPPDASIPWYTAYRR